MTEGKPSLHVVVTTKDFSERSVLSLAAALEASSEHPLAAAIVNGAKQRGAPSASATAFRTLVGKGAVATIDGNQVTLGNESLMRELGVDVSALGAQVASLSEQGQTLVYMAVNERLAAAFGIADRVKPSTPEALSALRALGLRIVMLSGDSKTTANAVAKQLGITEVHAEVLPQQKNDAVTALRAQGRIVAMAGDGTNDAPALAAALFPFAGLRLWVTASR